MSKRHDEMTCLAISQARLKIASDMLRWSLNGETKGILPEKEVLEVAAKIDGWMNLVWKTLRDNR